MRKRNVSEELSLEEIKYMDNKQLALYLNTGTATARKLAEDAEAIIRLGRCIRFNRDKIDKHMHSISGE